MVAFSSNNRKKSGYVAYPKVKLTTGERARIAIVDEEPVAVYVHSLEAVVTDDFGKPVMVEREFKNGNKKSYPKKAFVAAYKCTGDFKTLEETGSDAENCVMCAAALDPETGSAFAAPYRKFAIHVLQYKLNPNSTKVQNPFQADLKAWVFPDGKFNRLVEIADEHGSLNERDLLLGPCESAEWQKFDIQIAGGEMPEWTKDSDRKKLVAALLENRSEDLESLIARPGTPAEIALSMREVTSAWEVAFAKPSVTNEAIAEARKVQSSPITTESVVADFLKGVQEDESAEYDNEDEEATEEAEEEGVDVASILAQFKK